MLIAYWSITESYFKGSNIGDLYKNSSEIHLRISLKLMVVQYYPPFLYICKHCSNITSAIKHQKSSLPLTVERQNHKRSAPVLPSTNLHCSQSGIINRDCSQSESLSWSIQPLSTKPPLNRTAAASCQLFLAQRLAQRCEFLPRL